MHGCPRLQSAASGFFQPDVTIRRVHPDGNTTGTTLLERSKASRGDRTPGRQTHERRDGFSRATTTHLLPQPSHMGSIGYHGPVPK